MQNTFRVRDVTITCDGRTEALAGFAVDSHISDARVNLRFCLSYIHVNRVSMDPVLSTDRQTHERTPHLDLQEQDDG